MSGDEKKPASPLNTGSPASPKPAAQQPAPPLPAKTPAISRRAFVVGAMGVSALLTIASLSQSGGILGPLIPAQEGDTVVANYNVLNKQYMDVKGTPNELSPSNYSQVFYYPYPVTASPYFKNVVARLPDPLINPYYQNDQSPQGKILQHVVAFNLTCVHLRCIVNPGYDFGEYRLICPCHGSEYRLVDAVPVAGPAKDLGLNPLPRVMLRVDPSSGNITATGSLYGEPGIGRTD